MLKAIMLILILQLYAPSQASDLSFRGANVVLWGFNHEWFESTLRKLRDIGFDSVLLTVYLKMDSPNSSYVRRFEYTPEDDEIRLAISKARGMGVQGPPEDSYLPRLWVGRGCDARGYELLA